MTPALKMGDKVRVPGSTRTSTVRAILGPWAWVTHGEDGVPDTYTLASLTRLSDAP